MTVNMMREVIIKAYEGKKWREKVLSMPDNQVIAVYRRLQRKGVV